MHVHARYLTQPSFTDHTPIFGHNHNILPLICTPLVRYGVSINCVWIDLYWNRCLTTRSQKRCSQTVFISWPLLYLVTILLQLKQYTRCHTNNVSKSKRRSLDIKIESPGVEYDARITSYTQLIVLANAFSANSRFWSSHLSLTYSTIWQMKWSHKWYWIDWV